MKSITGKTKVCGVIGKPIDHTLSPLIHHTIAAFTHENLAYVPFLVEENRVEDALKGAHALGIKGLNVTMPHKKAVMPCCVAIDPLAQQVDAVNTLVWTHEGYKGYNTDAMGLRRALKHQGIPFKGQNVAIIGSGGASYAAVVSVMEEARSIHIFNRTKENARVLQEHFKEKCPVPITIYEMGEKPKVKIDVVIQTTGVGMGNLKGQMPTGASELLEQANAAVDLIYNPSETVFLKEARHRDLKRMNGFDMLFYQAIIAYELMHQVTIDESSIQAIYMELMKEIG